MNKTYNQIKVFKSIEIKSYPLIIGIGGCIRAGKDTLAKVLTSSLLRNSKLPMDVKSFAFAEPLKEGLKETVRSKYNLDVFTNDTAAKEVFRQDLIDYASEKRILTKGQYFIDNLKSRVFTWWERKNFSPRAIAIITDTRFKEYIYDEIDFVKNHGYLVHIQRIKDNKVLAPTNEKEMKNDPIVQTNSDYHIVWDTFNPESLHENEWPAIEEQYTGEITENILEILD